MLKKLCIALLLVGCANIICMERQKEVANPNVPAGDIISRTLNHTALHKAALEGKLADVQRLLKNPHVDVNARDKAGDTPLHLAASQHHAAIIHALLQDPRTNVNALNNENGTPLHEAATRYTLAAQRDHSLTAIKELLKAPRINVNARNRYGFTALQLAQKNKQHDIAQIIQEYINDKAAMAAFLHATHERLGQDSPAQDLPDWITQQINQEVMEKELPNK